MKKLYNVTIIHSENDFIKCQKLALASSVKDAAIVACQDDKIYGVLNKAEHNFPYDFKIGNYEVFVKEQDFKFIEGN
jgi:hypothetical protein